MAEDENVVYEKGRDKITIKDNGIELTTGSNFKWMQWGRFMEEWKGYKDLKDLARKAGNKQRKIDGEM